MIPASLWHLQVHVFNNPLERIKANFIQIEVFNDHSERNECNKMRKRKFQSSIIQNEMKGKSERKEEGKTVGIQQNERKKKAGQKCSYKYRYQNTQTVKRTLFWWNDMKQLANFWGNPPCQATNPQIDSYFTWKQRKISGYFSCCWNGGSARDKVNGGEKWGKESRYKKDFSTLFFWRFIKGETST